MDDLIYKVLGDLLEWGRGFPEFENFMSLLLETMLPVLEPSTMYTPNYDPSIFQVFYHLLLLFLSIY